MTRRSKPPELPGTAPPQPRRRGDREPEHALVLELRRAGHRIYRANAQLGGLGGLWSRPLVRRDFGYWRRR